MPNPFDSIPALAAAIAGRIDIRIPWDAIRDLPTDVVDAVATGDTTTLRAHVAEALDDAVDLSALPVIGAWAEEEQGKLAEALVGEVVDRTAEEIRAGLLQGRPSKALRLAVAVVSSPEEAAAVLAMGPIWKALHPALVKAARGWA